MRAAAYLVVTGVVKASQWLMPSMDRNVPVSAAGSGSKSVMSARGGSRVLGNVSIPSTRFAEAMYVDMSMYNMVSSIVMMIPQKSIGVSGVSQLTGVVRFWYSVKNQSRSTR